MELKLKFQNKSFEGVLAAIIDETSNSSNWRKKKSLVTTEKTRNAGKMHFFFIVIKKRKKEEKGWILSKAIGVCTEKSENQSSRDRSCEEIRSDVRISCLANWFSG